MKKIFFLFAVFSCLQMWAGSILLLNDTPYVLRAVIRGNDGTYLGEVVINSHNSSRWTDTYGQLGSYGAPPANSLTPYTVRWYCNSGDDFSFCTNVATGATVSAKNCDGRRICGPKSSQKQNEAAPPEGYLVPETQQQGGEAK